VLSGTGHRLVRGLSSPVVTGWRKACIWLPEESAQWPEAKVRAVCLHELAHHARHDGAWQWLGWLAASVWWWNPLAWLSLRRLTAEAELSADESALSQQIAATDYAQMLVEIAAGGDLSTPAAGVAMLGRSGIETRVRALLSGAGPNGIFGRKAKLALVLTAFAAVMAAGVEVRHAAQLQKLSEPLSEAEKAHVEDALAVLEPQLEKLQRVHLKMTETWSMDDVISPRPSEIEAWVNEPARQARIEYRPRVALWTHGAAPWAIRDATEVTNGTHSWSYERGDHDARISPASSDSLFPVCLYRPRARELIGGLKAVLKEGYGFPAQHVLRREEDRIVIELQWAGASRLDRWEVDLKHRGLALYRSAYPKSPEPFSVQWSVEKWAQFPDGTSYPARMNWKYHLSDGPGSHTFDVQSLEVIDGVSSAMLAPPEKKASPFVATDGIAQQGQWLETRFVHSETGKPVPEVKVHFEINRGDRTELISDAQGVLRIPLPKQEIKFLRYWGMKAGFVMQEVRWRRQGDPLKLPEVYETKLFPAGKPIGGTIVDAAGQPVEGAPVSALHTGRVFDYDDGVFSDVHTSGKWKARTDANGNWSMTGFAEDLSGLIIWVEHPRYKRIATEYETASGQRLESLRDGTSRLVLNSADLEVSGVISDTNGKPVPNCSVTLTEDHWGRFDEPNAKSDAEGRFAVPVHEKGKEWFTFEAAGFAPQMVELDVNAESAKRLVVVKLRPGAFFKAKVVDEAGKPLPGVKMIADRWQEKRTLWFEGMTDAEGRMEWRGAPPDAVKRTLLGKDRIVRDLPISADGTEQVVVLRPALRFTGTVVDAQTGLPLKTFQVTPGDSRRSAADIFWQEEDKQTFRDGEFTFESEWMRFDHKLRISAEGCQPFETALFTPKQQTETLIIRLKSQR
jgi:protocatechuate 3,4-dioxygenase beta subunit